MLAVLMHVCSLDLWQAWKLVQERRPKVRPNAGFLLQLEAYERRIRGTSSVAILGGTFHSRAPAPPICVEAEATSDHASKKRSRRKRTRSRERHSA
mmetsp:Transcript_56509/g.126242  ORF Transcript_56509/g.126242 Transcript_56509/m.126242 type:complete len:96 (-) Transcript_56509:679-966(-)